MLYRNHFRHITCKVTLLSCPSLLHRLSFIVRNRFSFTESKANLSWYSALELLASAAASVKMPKVTKKTSKEEEALRPIPTAMDTDVDDGPSTSGAKVKFAPMSAIDQNGRKIEFRRVTVPQQRLTPLKTAWLSLYQPITEQLHLDMRMNLKNRKVEIKTTPKTVDIGHLQKAADFVHAFILGFEVADAIALLRLDDLFIESFEIKDVKTLRGEHLSRCIGRISGKNGKTKFSVENATKTRVVLADTRIHILGSYQNIRVCRDAICGLIMGSPAGKVYSRLRSVCSRLNSSY